MSLMDENTLPDTHIEEIHSRLRESFSIQLEKARSYDGNPIIELIALLSDLHLVDNEECYCSIF